MKTAKIVIGIISIVLFIVVMFQSCAAGLYNSLVDSSDVSGAAGVILAICMLIAGIISIATRNGGKGGPIVAGIFYLFGGIMGIANYGIFADLMIWSIVCFIFAAVDILGTILWGTGN